MKSRNDLRPWLLSSVLVIAACGGGSSAGGKGGAGGGVAGATGGAIGTSGTGGRGTGGSTGGAAGAGGTTGGSGTGGATGNAGAGGGPGSGGSTGTGGQAGTGGAGTSGTGGAAGRGGTGGTAGSAGTGGTVGSGGTPGTGGQAGTGGAGGMGACLASLKVTQVAVNSLDNPMTAPIFVTGAPGTTDLFVAGQSGQVYLLKNGAGPATLFLDIASKVKPNNEDGLLGLAFHPGYATNGRFFVNFVTNSSPLTVAVAEYARSATNPDLADTAEKRRLILGAKDFANGSGGMLTFGPDGYLYVGLGEETTLLTTTGATLSGPGGSQVHGSIVRLDVSTAIAHAPGGGSYPAPLWATGLRQPWRFSFDRTTNDLYLGDVGDNTREEVDFEAFAGRVGGRNYGWNLFEGSYCHGVAGGAFNAECTAGAPSAVFPLYDYAHAGGDGAVIGGYVYRGQKIPCLTGTYLFGDYETTTVRALVVTNGALGGTPQMVPGVSYVGATAALTGLTSFGQDNNGELYLVHVPASGNGAIYRIDPK